MADTGFLSPGTVTVVDHVTGSSEHADVATKESTYSGLSIKMDAGGQPNWGLLGFNTSAKTWDVEARNDSNIPEVWWDGSKRAASTHAFWPWLKI